MVTSYPLQLEEKMGSPNRLKVTWQNALWGLGHLELSSNFVIVSIYVIQLCNSNYFNKMI
ncbi:hypothetical protein AAZX31_02G065400 [Glycine max]